MTHRECAETRDLEFPSSCLAVVTFGAVGILLPPRCCGEEGVRGLAEQYCRNGKKKKKELFYRELREKQNLYSHGWIRRHVLLRLDYRCQLLYQLWPTKVMGNVMSSHGGAVDGMPLI